MSDRIAFTSCVENKRLFALKRSFGNQLQAISACETEFAGTLGPIRSAVEFNEVIQGIVEAELFFENNDEVNRYLIGLEAKNGQGNGGGNTSAFSFINGTDTGGLDLFQDGVGSFPWAFNQPNNNLAFTENCAASRFETIDTSGLLHDFNCNLGFDGAICRSPCNTRQIDIPINKTLFKIVIENEIEGAVTPNQAVDRCSLFLDEFDDPMKLGPIQGELEFNEIIDQLTASPEFLTIVQENINIDITLDLRVPVRNRDRSEINTTDYLFLDEDLDADGLEFFHGPIGRFPWAPNEPNNRLGIQNCVHLVAIQVPDPESVIFRLFDRECEGRLADAFLCRGQTNFDVKDDADNDNPNNDEIDDLDDISNVENDQFELVALVMSVIFLSSLFIFFVSWVKHFATLRKFKRKLLETQADH